MSDPEHSLLPQTDKVLHPDMKPPEKPPEGAHSHDDHHHHDSPLPPPEPDVYVSMALYMWGIGTFLAVVISIIVLGGYFWTERGMETAGNRVDSASLLFDGLQELRATEAENLGSYKKLEGDAYRIPIDRAKELMVQEAAKK